MVGGGTGAGLERNIMSAYEWRAERYQPGDHIFLFGFSRGAYTVRSLGGLLAHSGLPDLSDPAPTPASVGPISNAACGATENTLWRTLPWLA